MLLLKQKLISLSVACELIPSAGTRVVETGQRVVHGEIIVDNIFLS